MLAVAISWSLLVFMHVQYTGKFGAGQIWWIMSYSPKCSSPIFTDTLAYALTVAYSPHFSSPLAFTCMVHQNFPLPNIFLCTVVWYMYVPTELLALPDSLKVCFKLTVMLLFVFSGHPIVKSLNNRSHDWEWLKYYLNHNLHRFLVAIDTYIKY